MSVFLATYFETNGHFDSHVKLFPVIYTNYRPMTDAKRKLWKCYIKQFYKLLFKVFFYTFPITSNITHRCVQVRYTRQLLIGFKHYSATSVCSSKSLSEVFPWHIFLFHFPLFLYAFYLEQHDLYVYKILFMSIGHLIKNILA